MTGDAIFVCEPSEVLLADFDVVHHNLSIADFVGLKKGGPPGNLSAPLELSCDRPQAHVRTWDILFSNKSLFVTSAEVTRTLADEFGDDLAFLPCSMRTCDCVTSDWFIMVVTSMFRIIDVENSQVSYIPDSEQLMGFRSLSLLNASTSAPNVFRDPVFRSMIFVSTRFVDVIQSHGWKGFQFPSAKGYIR